MSNRTVKIYGLGFGLSPASIQVTLSGNVVYDGTVSTSSDSIPQLPNIDIANDTTEICAFELPVSFEGTMPMTCKVTNGTVIFAQIEANYIAVQNPVFTQADLAILENPNSTRAERSAVFASHAVPQFTSEEITFIETSTLQEHAALLQQHGVGMQASGGTNVYGPLYFNQVSADPRLNVTIDGVSQTVDHQQYPGTWWWIVKENSTIAYDLQITAGME